MFLDVPRKLLSEMGATLTLLLTGMICLFIVWFLKKKPKLPPGPRSLPIFGNLLQIKGSSISAKITEWARIYGPIITVYLGRSQAVIINDLDLLNEAYVTKEKDFSDKSLTPSMSYGTGGGMEIAFNPRYDRICIIRRKLAMQALRQYITGNQHAERVNGILGITITNIIKDLSVSKDGGSVGNEGIVQLKTHLDFAMINVIHSMCFGYTMDIESLEYKNVVHMYRSISGNTNGFLEDAFPLLAHFPSKSFRKFMQDIDAFVAYTRKHIQQERDSFDENVDSHNLVYNMILAEKQDPTGGEAFNDESLPYIVNDFFFAGIDTTRHTLEWLLLVLANRPDIQTKVQTEIDRTVESSVPGREHRSGLVYTEAVIQETTRLYPAAPLGLPHQTARDTSLMGYDIPKNTTVMANVFAIHRDPKLWDRPTEFIPERFISTNEKGEQVLRKHPGLIPFLIGPRNCIGEAVGKQSLLFLTTGLLHKLEFRLKPGDTADFEPDPADFINLACKPYEVFVRVRD